MKTLISEDEIQKRVKELSLEILKDQVMNHPKKDLELICILEGSSPFFRDLTKNIEELKTEYQFNINVNQYFMQAKSYSGTKTVGSIKILRDLTDEQKDYILQKDLYIVEDIVDTGNTISFLMNYLNQFNPNSIKIISLLDKPCGRNPLHKEINPDYCCFNIPDKFVIGYGLDFNGEYRDLPFIAEYEENFITYNFTLI